MSSGITVVIPVHPPRLSNGMLARAIASVAAQTLPADALSIAVDNERCGAWYTRQRALDAVQTEWTAFLDSDDEFLPEHLALHAEWAERERADFVYAWFQIRPERRAAEDPFPPEFFTEPWWPDRPRHTTTTVMVRTELAKAVGFTEPIPNADVGHEDWKFTLGCYEVGAKIVHVPGVRTWLWHWEAGNTSGLAYRPDGEPTW